MTCADQATKRLSRQEESVLGLASAGLGDKEIALRLGISLATVRTYWQRIRSKLNVVTRAEAASSVASHDLSIILQATEHENEALLDEVKRRRLAEALLAQSEARFKYVCHAATEGIFMGDVRGKCTYANPACLQILGCCESEILDSGLSHFSTDDQNARMARAAILAVNRSDRFVGEFDFVRSNGEKRLLRVSLQRVGDVNAHVGYIGCLEDLTDSRELEREFDEMRRFADCVSAATEDIVHVYDIASKTTVYVNHVSEKLFGMSSRQIKELGPSALALLIDERDHAEIQRVQASYASMRDSDSAELRFRVLAASGERHTVAGRLVVFRRDEFGTPRQMLGVLKVLPLELAAAA